MGKTTKFSEYDARKQSLNIHNSLGVVRLFARWKKAEQYFVCGRRRLGAKMEMIRMKTILSHFHHLTSDLHSFTEAQPWLIEF